MATSDVPETLRTLSAQSLAYFEVLKVDADEAATRLAEFAVRSQEFVEFEAEDAFRPNYPTRYGTGTIDDLERASLLLDPNFFDPDKFRGHTYDSTFFDFLSPQLTAFIEDESTGIAPAVQQAIFDKQREQDLQVFNDAVVQAEASVGRRGFPLPTDMSQAARMEVIGKYNDVNTDRVAQTTALIAERAQDNVKHAIDAGIRMEDIQSQFTRFFHQMYMDYNRVLIDKFKVETDANIAALRGTIDRVNASTQLRSMEMQGDLKYRDQLMEKWRISESMEIQRTRDLIAQSEEAVRIQIQASTSLTEYYRTIVAGVAGQINLITNASESLTKSE